MTYNVQSYVTDYTFAKWIPITRACGLPDKVNEDTYHPISLVKMACEVSVCQFISNIPPLLLYIILYFSVPFHLFSWCIIPSTVCLFQCIGNLTSVQQKLDWCEEFIRSRFYFRPNSIKCVCEMSEMWDECKVAYKDSDLCPLKWMTLIRLTGKYNGGEVCVHSWGLW